LKKRNKGNTIKRGRNRGDNEKKIKNRTSQERDAAGKGRDRGAGDEFLSPRQKVEKRDNIRQEQLSLKF